MTTGKEKRAGGSQSARAGKPKPKEKDKDIPTMKRFQSAESQRRYSRQMRDKGKRIGFVPTLGALHEGHLALIRKARSQSDIVVVSIFVNPLQFGPGEDYDRYPRDLARDMDLARQNGVDAVFVPEVAEMYPPEFAAKISMGSLTEKMCGASRPGHFDGVCTVVMKLLGVVQPHRLYLGRKDAQQLRILERMIADLNLDVKVTACPTVREKDGLAVSSRNLGLSEAHREQAPRLHAALRLAQREILVEHVRDPQMLTRKMRKQIASGSEIDIEYIAVIDPETFEELPTLTGRVLIAVAARLGDVRLIDNIQINVPGGRMAEGFATGRTPRSSGR